MSKGYNNKILRVNLSTREISEEALPESVLKKWIGGVGLGAKYLFDEVPAEVGWNHPDNRVIIASGALGGTRVPGSGGFCLCTKGALTGGGASSQANGFLGAFLRFCGYDALIIQGAAPEWVYLYIDENGASICDAIHLLGVDTWDIQEVLKKELKTEKVSIYSIGPAGEKLVRFASFIGDYGHVAAHNGVGAVLGSKKLKAIAVARGTKKLQFHDEKALSELARLQSESAKAAGNNKLIIEHGTTFLAPLMHKTGGLPVKNLSTNIFPENAKFTGEYLRPHFEVKTKTCWACGWAHCRYMKINEGPYAGFEGEEPEYEALAAMGPIIGQTDPIAAVFLANLVDRLGIDVNETGWLIGWVMECYEKGYLTKEDLDGLEMTWGNVQATRELLNKIASRQGIGDMLAEGVKRSAEKVGADALSCAVYTLKGNTPRGHDHRAIWRELFDTCISSTGTIEATGGGVRADQFGLKPISDPFDWVQVIDQIAKTNGYFTLKDSLVICRFPNEFIDLIVKSVNAATGWDLTIDQALAYGRRVSTLMRIFNYRCGITKELDAPSQRYGSTPVDGPAKGIGTKEIWDEATRRFYELMGWEPESGYPLQTTLEALGLDDLV